MSTVKSEGVSVLDVSSSPLLPPPDLSPTSRQSRRRIREAVEVDAPKSGGGGVIGCPICGSLRAAIPTLTVRYSSCCGLIACTNCIARAFPVTSRVARIACPHCGELIGAGDFHADTLNTQRVHADIKLRNKLKQILNLTLADFNDNQREYDDFLEFTSEYLYGAVDGSAHERARADDLLQQYAKINQAKLDKARKKRALDEANAAAASDAASIMTDTNTASAASAPVIPSFNLPTAIMNENAFHLLFAKLRSDVDGAIHRDFNALRKRAMAAAGHGDALVRQRIQDEQWHAM